MECDFGQPGEQGSRTRSFKERQLLGRCAVAFNTGKGIPAGAGTAKAVRLPQDRLNGLPQEGQHSDGNAGIRDRQPPAHGAASHISELLPCLNDQNCRQRDPKSCRYEPDLQYPTGTGSVGWRYRCPVLHLPARRFVNRRMCCWLSTFHATINPPSCVSECPLRDSPATPSLEFISGG